MSKASKELTVVLVHLWHVKIKTTGGFIYISVEEGFSHGYSQLKFMHDFHHGKLPLSFNETWVPNRIRNPDLEMRNADNLYSMYLPIIMPLLKDFHCLRFPGHGMKQQPSN